MVLIGSLVYQIYETNFVLGVVYQIKQVTLADGSRVYPLWLSRDPEDPGEGGRSYANLTFASSFNSTFNQSALNDQSLGAVSDVLKQYAKYDGI